ncbi:MAG: replication initiation protein [Spirochaetes bacterium]|nr:replication initiation protein [Spirochaetota bacterium]
MSREHLQVKDPDVLDYFVASLPEKPYCTNRLGALIIQEKANALKNKYIQHNSPYECYWLVYDVDRPTAIIDWQDANAPTPTIIAMNPENGHAHLFYGLQNPVLTAEYNPKVHKSPIRYAASIDVAMTKKLEADPCYSKLISKNPIHNYWKVSIWQNELYDLPGLASHLDLEPYTDKRIDLEPLGLGRNCTLFKYTAKYAYKSYRKGGFLNNEFYWFDVENYAKNYNMNFTPPLPLREVYSIVRSVIKWTAAKHTQNGFTEIQRRRGLLSGISRKAKAGERRERIIEYIALCPWVSNVELANIFEVSISTINHLNLKKGCVLGLSTHTKQ